ncbi:MAG: DUF4349 domain-containing protein [Actinomycetota bacterium]
MTRPPADDALPPIDDATVDRIETAVFAEIAPAAPVTSATAPRPRRRWLVGLGVAAAFAVGVLVTPPILGVVGGSTALNEAGSAVPDMPAVGQPGGTDWSSVDQQSAEDSVAESAAGGDTAQQSPDGTVADSGDRELIANAQATLEVADVQRASDAIAAIADERGGYVESTNLDRTSESTDASMPVPPGVGYSWISIRVPAADLAEVMSALGDTGEVVNSSISQQDVTATAIDLRARVDATRASVERLTALMAESGSVSELIEAEVALTDRQAQLEAYEQELAGLEDQVSMSTVQVQLVPERAPTSAEPAGFGDGLLAGWNGLIVSLNALVIAVGFLLPWLVVGAVLFLLVRLLLRRRRARRTEPDS